MTPETSLSRQLSSLPQPSQVVGWGKQALLAEAEALTLAAGRLGASFAAAVEVLSRCRGRVIVTGLGKSGHIGGKIAATLSSTGVPAQFVHASEALHGDFGMIAREDCLVAIAFGGETREVLSVAAFVRNNKQVVIAITGNMESSLARLSDVVLDGRIKNEADPLNLAPTSSSTVALALGDALAVALMNHRQFSREDFYALHPGGKLGRSLAQVSQWMHPLAKLSRIRRQEDFHAVLQAVTTPNFGICPVLNEQDQLEGAITDGDLRRALLQHGAEALKLTAESLMNRRPKTISPELRALDAITMMEQFKITAIFVQCQISMKLLGLLRLHDLLEGKIV